MLGPETQASAQAARLRRLIVGLEPPQQLLPPGPEPQAPGGALPGVPAEVAVGMNPQQAEAVRQVLGARDYTLVLGMPGSGKTTTIVAIVAALAAQGKRVLVTSYTNRWGGPRLGWLGWAGGGWCCAPGGAGWQRKGLLSWGSQGWIEGWVLVGSLRAWGWGGVLASRVVGTQLLPATTSFLLRPWLSQHHLLAPTASAAASHRTPPRVRSVQCCCASPFRGCSAVTPLLLLRLSLQGVQCCHTPPAAAFLRSPPLCSAVDNILMKLAQGGVPFVRLGRPSGVHPAVRPFVPGGERYPQTTTTALKQLAETVQVVGGGPRRDGAAVAATRGLPEWRGLGPGWGAG